MQHITVLQDEAVAALAIKPAATIVDATLGRGGHTDAILSQLGSEGHCIAIDVDKTAIDSYIDTHDRDSRLELLAANFREINAVLAEHHVTSVDGILADLGWRMEQFTSGGKGFSFQTDEPLQMTFGDPTTYPFTASDIVNDWDEEVLINIFKGYGEERYARRIARAIVEQRATNTISSSQQLADVVSRAVPARYAHGKIHPATRIFQALRIAVNDELEALEAFITSAVEVLAPHGRLAIITFHSIEDRIVKHRFRQLQTEGKGLVITKKPIIATETELTANPRARSAKLRTFERI